MSGVLFESGDEAPRLIVRRADEVRPYDIVWGVQYQDNIRKGFLMENEGIQIREGARPVIPNQVKLGFWPPMDAWRLVLVELQPDPEAPGGYS